MLATDPRATGPRIAGISPTRIDALATSERSRFERDHPHSREAAARGGAFYAGVPLHWMLDWSVPFALIAAAATGATLVDLDGIDYADFCLGDTGSMFGHSPTPVVRALAEQAPRGFTTMLPSAAAHAVGSLLRERFALPHWQLATTASDANRFALRIAREVTQRPKILIMNGCYHGAVDETYVSLDAGRAVNVPSLLGQFTDLAANTRVIEFNDVAALERALAPLDVACVITEPVLTNCSMVLPAPGFHAALRRLTRAHGTLLLIDETHTLSSGPRGYCGAHDLRPDIFVVGKAIASGIPAAAWGFTDDIAAGWDRARLAKPFGHSGLGTTLSANALAIAAMHATLAEVMTDAAYEHMEALAATLQAGLEQVIDARKLPWHVARAGARVEMIFTPAPLKNGGEALQSLQPALERIVRLALLNRGVLIAPFHNMMLVSPATTAEQVQRLVAAFDEICGLLVKI